MSTNLDSEFFKIIEDNERRLRLIIPSHSAACANTIWNNQNKWYRSRVETFNGDTVSQGFPKFLNLGQENAEIGVGVNDIVEAIRDHKRVVATLKVDGSCLLRSVYKDEIMFRTRGSFSYEFHDNAHTEMKLFQQRYPKLLDATWMADRTLIFEWISPNAQIVIKYEEPDLILIGGVHHGHRHYSHLRYLTTDELNIIAVEGNLSMMEHFVIDSVKDWYSFYHQTLNRTDIEGFVIRIEDD